MSSAASSLSSASVVQRLMDLDKDVQSLYETVPFGSHCVNHQGVFHSVNATESAWLGLAPRDLIGRLRPDNFFTPDSQALLRAHQSLYGKHGFAGLELELVGADGTIRPVSMTSMPLPANDPAEVIHRVVLFDLSERQQRMERQRVAALAFDSNGGTCITDDRGVILLVNQAFMNLTGFSSDELRGQTMHLLHSGRHDPAFYADMWSQLLAQGHWQGEVIDRRKDGTEFFGWLNISAIHGSTGFVSYYVGSLYDITASKVREEEIRHLAFFDALTRLPNRKLLQDRLSQTLSSLARTQLHGALLFIDMDNFKTLNDTRGHAAGDQLLIEVGRRLLNSVRDGDTVARVGGDEFVVLLSDLSADMTEAANQANHIGRKILVALAAPYPFGDYSFNCSASMGVSVFTCAQSALDLLKQADMAMYEAKKTGRNTLCFFNPLMQATIDERSSIEQALILALDHGELELFFQPQFTADHRVIAAEALLRWRHPDRGILSPNFFLHVAEEAGQIVPIGRWVLHQACETLKRWAGLPHMASLSLSVNVSAKQFARADFVQQMIELIQLSAVNPERLMLELTETTVHDVNDIRLKMQRLQAMGVTFSLDDFGNGYSSLSRLIELPIHELKIDLAFVQAAAESASARVVIETVLGMAKTLGLHVIAEGVETQSQMSYLESAGCTLYQGYLVSAAIPAEEFEALVLQMNVSQA